MWPLSRPNPISRWTGHRGLYLETQSPWTQNPAYSCTPCFCFAIISVLWFLKCPTQCLGPTFPKIDSLVLPVLVLETKTLPCLHLRPPLVPFLFPTSGKEFHSQAGSTSELLNSDKLKKPDSQEIDLSYYWRQNFLAKCNVTFFPSLCMQAPIWANKHCGEIQTRIVTNKNHSVVIWSNQHLTRFEGINFWFHMSDRERCVFSVWFFGIQGGRSCAGARVAPAKKFGLGRKF